MSRMKSLFAVSMITVQYSLPVPPNLAQYAQFQLPAVENNPDSSHVELSYPLPQELTGNAAQTIQLKGEIVKGQPLVLEGDNASATCTITTYNAINQCQIVYRKLNLNSAAVASFISQQFTDPAEIQGRLQVANLFASEPVGVLTYVDSGNDH